MIFFSCFFLFIHKNILVFTISNTQFDHSSLVNTVLEYEGGGGVEEGLPILQNYLFLFLCW